MTPCYCTSNYCSCRNGIGYGYGNSIIVFTTSRPESILRRAIDEFMAWAIKWRCVFWGNEVKLLHPSGRVTISKPCRSLFSFRRVRIPSFNRYPSAAHRSGLRTARP